ncbi:MAG: hypothetical protein ACRDKS_01380 [Actinomycetota bacterium]
MIDALLPGSEYLARGISDLERGVESVPSLLVSIGRPRLVRAGLDVPGPVSDRPEERLYELLAGEDPRTAHARYNALIRRLISFERATECAG